MEVLAAAWLDSNGPRADLGCQRRRCLCSDWSCPLPGSSSKRGSDKPAAHTSLLGLLFISSITWPSREISHPLILVVANHRSRRSMAVEW